VIPGFPGTPVKEGNIATQKVPLAQTSRKLRLVKAPPELLLATKRRFIYF
jgi:hypothetical protein